MKATRLQQIESKVTRLREMMNGDNKEFVGIKTKNKLGMTRLRRA